MSKVKIEILKDIDNIPFKEGNIVEASEFNAGQMIRYKNAKLADLKAKTTSKEELKAQLDAKLAKIAAKAKEKAAEAGIKLESAK